MNLIAELRERGLLHDVMPGTEEQLNKEMTSGYIGFDPTADSLHIGSMLQITLLMRLQKAGHKPYALIGGATGMIGDPSGKSAERNLLDAETIERNCAGQRKQLEKFLDFTSDAPNAAVMVNNYDWFKNFSFLDFIRDVGKNITVNYMMSKDSVQKRLETGLSFTEFTYQLIQGYDFFHLNTHHNVKLQMGGSDQWGNIVTGTELIRRKGGGDAFALVSPLITKSDGSKFGKSEGGNIWLDPERTSPYEFYQFWLKLPDDDAARLLLIYSFRPLEELHAIIAEHKASSGDGKRIAQNALADEITTLVHSAEALEHAKHISRILFGKATIDALRALSDREIVDAMRGLNNIALSKGSLAEGINIINFLADNEIMPSRGEAKKMLQNRGIAVNKDKVGIDFVIKEEHLLNGKYLLVQKGTTYTLATFN